MAGKDDKTTRADEKRTFEVRTPVADFRGTSAGVDFLNGLGKTDSPAVAEQCRRLGYLVIDVGDAEAVKAWEKRRKQKADDLADAQANLERAKARLAEAQAAARSLE